MNWEPIILTFQLALIVTAVLFVISVPLGNWLASSKSKIKPVIEALVSMPLVLPPTVLGFYLLVAFGQNSHLGQFLNEVLGLQLIFSFEGLIVASVIYSLPFMVQPIQSGLSHLPQNLRETSYLMGKSKWETLRKVELPNIKPALLTGLVLTFAHTIGEFGVVMMIGGNIPSETKVASIAIYDEVESLNYDTANQYAIFLIIITFIILLTVYLINDRSFKPFSK